MEIEVTNIEIVNPNSKNIDATGPTGVLFGTRGDYRTLIVRTPNVAKPLSTKIIYQCNMIDGDGHRVLGVKLKYNSVSPQGSLVFGTP